MMPIRHSLALERVAGSADGSSDFGDEDHDHHDA